MQSHFLDSGETAKDQQLASFTDNIQNKIVQCDGRNSVAQAAGQNGLRVDNICDENSIEIKYEPSIQNLMAPIQEESESYKDFENIDNYKLSHIDFLRDNGVLSTFNALSSQKQQKCHHSKGQSTEELNESNRSGATIYDEEDSFAAEEQGQIIGANQTAEAQHLGEKRIQGSSTWVHSSYRASESNAIQPKFEDISYQKSKIHTQAHQESANTKGKQFIISNFKDGSGSNNPRFRMEEYSPVKDKYLNNFLVNKKSYIKRVVAGSERGSGVEKGRKHSQKNTVFENSGQPKSHRKDEKKPHSFVAMRPSHFQVKKTRKQRLSNLYSSHQKDTQCFKPQTERTANRILLQRSDCFDSISTFCNQNYRPETAMTQQKYMTAKYSKIYKCPQRLGKSFNPSSHLKQNSLFNDLQKQAIINSNKLLKQNMKKGKLLKENQSHERTDLPIKKTQDVQKTGEKKGVKVSQVKELEASRFLQKKDKEYARLEQTVMEKVKIIMKLGVKLPKKTNKIL